MEVGCPIGMRLWMNHIGFVFLTLGRGQALQNEKLSLRLDLESWQTRRFWLADFFQRWRMEDDLRRLPPRPRCLARSRSPGCPVHSTRPMRSRHRSCCCSVPSRAAAQPHARLQRVDRPTRRRKRHCAVLRHALAAAHRSTLVRMYPKRGQG